MKPVSQLFRLTFLFTVIISLITPNSALAGKKQYEYYFVGNSNDVNTPTQSGTVLMGGGTDVDAAFQWMINKSGGGDFVVIRAAGTDAYNPYIYSLGTVDSVETIIITSRTGASDPFVLDKIINAEALFIAGGDQANYVDYWKGTPVEDAIHNLIAQNVPVGGTSAGLAILGEFVFSAANGTVDSSTALGNPFGRRITLERDFLVVPHLNGLITDSHFVTRDRMGRLATFLARIVNDGWATRARGLGIDEETAVVVEADGSASILGNGAAYFLQTPGMPEVCLPRTNLTYRNISVYRISGSGTFNFATWTGNGGVGYSITAENGSVTSTQPSGSIY
jgi:cyanophycinase